VSACASAAPKSRLISDQRTWIRSPLIMTMGLYQAAPV
jgi:hypothetical protein